MELWRRQPQNFFEDALLDASGTAVKLPDQAGFRRILLRKDLTVVNERPNGRRTCVQMVCFTLW